MPPSRGKPLWMAMIYMERVIREWFQHVFFSTCSTPGLIGDTCAGHDSPVRFQTPEGRDVKEFHSFS